MNRNSGLAFHEYYGALFGYCFDYKRRQSVIETGNPPNERELRLRLFQLIPENRVPCELVEAGEAYSKAWESHEKAWESREEAREAFSKSEKAFHVASELFQSALAPFTPQIEELHRELCPDCPWDGKTIFPKKGVK